MIKRIIILSNITNLHILVNIQNELVSKKVSYNTHVFPAICNLYLKKFKIESTRIKLATAEWDVRST